MQERKFDIVGLSETQLKGSDRRIVHEEYKMVYNGDRAGRYGVVFMESSYHSIRVSHIKYVNVSLKQDEDLNTIQVYAS